jgi:hypothetical protein
MTKSPWTRARTPSGVVESIDSAVGLKTAASWAYSFTTAGAANAKIRIDRTPVVNSARDMIVGHRTRLDFFCAPPSVEADLRDADEEGRSVPYATTSSRRWSSGVDSDDSSNDRRGWSGRVSSLSLDGVGEEDLACPSSRGLLASVMSVVI